MKYVTFCQYKNNINIYETLGNFFPPSDKTFFLLNSYFGQLSISKVDDDFDFTTTVPYEAVSDYFLFDTKGKAHGGNGVKFNWALLKQYNGSKPLFLSGGIDLEDLPIIAKLNLLPLNLYALDVNSKFELEPALKDVLKVKQLKVGLHHCN